MFRARATGRSRVIRQEVIPAGELSRVILHSKDISSLNSSPDTSRSSPDTSRSNPATSSSRDTSPRSEFIRPRRLREASLLSETSQGLSRTGIPGRSRRQPRIRAHTRIPMPSRIIPRGSRDTRVRRVTAREMAIRRVPARAMRRRDTRIRAARFRVPVIFLRHHTSSLTTPRDISPSDIIRATMPTGRWDGDSRFL